MEIINSFTDTIKERTKNPFFGTLIFVWLFRNWEVVFAIFNFKEGFGHEEKIAFIEKHYENKLLWGIFTNNILIALGLMILGYLLIVLTRVIVNIVERKWMPYLNEKTDNTLVVSKERFIDVKRTRDEYAQKIEDSEESLIQNQQKLSQQKLENEKLLKEVQNTALEKINLVEARANSENRLMESERERHSLMTQIIALTNESNLIRENETKNLHDKFDFLKLASKYLKTIEIELIPNSVGMLEDEMLRSYLDIVGANLSETFYHFYESIYSPEMQFSVGSENFKKFSELGLITLNEQGKLLSTPSGDFFYFLLRSGIFRKKTKIDSN